jgi:anti-anti-sigma factor
MSGDRLEQISITSATSAEGACTVTVQGEIDVFNVGTFEQALERACGSKYVVVDLRQCRYIDSSTISALIRVRKKTGDKMRIVANGLGGVRRVLSLTHLEDVIPVVSSPEDLVF